MLYLDFAEQCEHLPIIEDGNIHLASNKSNRTAIVECDNGYTLLGPKFIACNVNGTWSSPGNCSGRLLFQTLHYNLKDAMSYRQVSFLISKFCCANCIIWSALHSRNCKFSKHIKTIHFPIVYTNDEGQFINDVTHF